MGGEGGMASCLGPRRKCESFSFSLGKRSIVYNTATFHNVEHFSMLHNMEHDLTNFPKYGSKNFSCFTCVNVFKSRSYF